MKTSAAGLLRVLACIVYDAILLAAVLFIATLAFLLVPASVRDTDPLIQAGKVLWYVGIAWLYFGWSWQRGGQTPGMKAWHTHLTDCEGELPSRSATVIRFFSAMLSWLLCGAGFIWILADREKRSLHDRLSGTCLVVKKRS